MVIETFRMQGNTRLRILRSCSIFTMEQRKNYNYPSQRYKTGERRLSSGIMSGDFKSFAENGCTVITK